MDRKHPRPQHASYLSHRRQVAWQIILPIVLAFLVLIAVIVLIAWRTFSAGGDSARWAEISTMWLTLPVMFGALVTLAFMIAATYLLGRLADLIPRYSYLAQKYAAQIEAGAKKIERVGHRPLLIFPEIGRLIKAGARAGLRRVRRG